MQGSSQDNTYISKINAIHKELDGVSSKTSFISNSDLCLQELTKLDAPASVPTCLNNELQSLYNRVKSMNDNIIV